MDGFLLVRAQEAKPVRLDEGEALGFILPSSFGGIAGALSQDDVIVVDHFFDELLRIGGDFLESDHRSGGGKGGDDGGITSLEIPEVVDVPVGEDDESAVQRPGITACLLLAREGILGFCLRLQDEEGESLLVEQEKVDESFGGFLEVFPDLIEGRLGEVHAGFEADICQALLVPEEAPTGCLEQLVDLDAGGGFLHVGQKRMYDL